MQSSEQLRWHPSCLLVKICWNSHWLQVCGLAKLYLIKNDYGWLGFHCSCKSRGICFVSRSRLQKMRTMRVCCHTHQLHLAGLALWLFRRHPRSLSLGRISASPCNCSDAVVVLLLHGKQFGLLSLACGQVSDSTNWNDVKEEVDGWQGDWQDWQPKESCPWKLRSGLNQNLDNLARASKPSFICMGTLRRIKLIIRINMLIQSSFDMLELLQSWPTLQEKSRRKRPRANGPLTESIGMSFAGLPPKQAVVSFLCRYYGRDIIKNVEVKYSVTGCDEDGWACVLTTIFLEGVQHHGVGSTQKAAEIAAAEAFLSHSQVEEVRKLLPPPSDMLKHSQPHGHLSSEARHALYNSFRDLGCPALWDGKAWCVCFIHN